MSYSEPEGLKKFREVNRTFPKTEEILELKKQAGLVFGWLCTYIPEEILHTAGILPVRISGYAQETELDDGNAYLYINNTPYTPVMSGHNGPVVAVSFYC